MKNVLIALVLAPLALLASCAAVAGIGMIVVISDEWKDNALSADVQEDDELVWASVKSSMSNVTDALLHVDEDHKSIQTRVDNAVVVVHVMEWSVADTRIYVDAKKYMISNPEVAELVMDRLIRDLAD